MAYETRKLLFISIFLQIALIISASPAPTHIPALKLFSRQNSDGICGSGSSKCANSVVSNFCCPSDTDCIPVLDNTAVGCCPKGQDCRVISPQTCNNVGVGLQTECTSGKSKGQCCPPGYICAGSFCQLPFESWPKEFGGTVVIAPTAGTSATAIPTQAGNATSLSEAQVEAGFINKSDCQVVTIGGVAAGLLPGLIVGSALTYLIVCARRRRKENLAKNFSRMPSVNGGPAQRKGSGSAKSLRQEMATGFNPNITVSSPPEKTDGLGMSNVIAGRNYAVSNTSTQMFSQYEETDASRRGRLRVHGETPQLPSLHGLGSATLASPQHFRSDSLQQHPPMPERSPEASQNSQNSKKHKRKNSNPSFQDVSSTSRFKFRNLLSHENLREDGRTASLTSETSVGSSFHSSVLSERQSRGLRYPIAVHHAPESFHSKGSAQSTPTSVKQHNLAIKPVQRTETNSSDRTPIEDDYTPITPSDPYALADPEAPIPPPAPVPPVPSNIKVPPQSHPLREQLTSPELHDRYLNIPRSVMDRTSVATTMTEMSEDSPMSPFHDRNKYRSYTSEASEEQYDSDDDGRSVAMESTYPSSFLDIHFDASSPVSPINNNVPMYGNLRNVPSIPAIPPLFQNKTQQSMVGQASSTNEKLNGALQKKESTISGTDRGSYELTVKIEDGLGPASPWRHNFSNISARGPLGLGNTMTGGRYTMQTMEITKF